MAPTKRRAQGYVKSLTDLVERQPISQGFGLPYPFAAQMQTRQQLYDVLGYEAYEHKLDQLFAADHNKDLSHD